MQRYLCILGLAGTNKVIPVEHPLRHLRHPVGECALLRFERDKPALRQCLSDRAEASDTAIAVCRLTARGHALRAREEGLGRVEHVSGDPGAIRTRDPQIRNLMLYPAELRGHKTQWQWCGLPESAPRRETYVSRRAPAISRERRFSRRPLPHHAIGSKHLAVRSKVDIDPVHRNWSCPAHGISGPAVIGGALFVRGRGKCVYS